MNVQFFSDLAYSALALLVAVLAIYLALRLLGKLAKLVVIVIVIAAVAWFLLSDTSPVQILALSAPSWL